MDEENRYRTDHHVFTIFLYSNLCSNAQPVVDAKSEASADTPPISPAADDIEESSRPSKPSYGNYLLQNV